jgi:hypothetical protein
MTKLALLLTALFCLMPSPARAQNGILDGRTRFEFIHGIGMGSTPGPLLCIVLWTGAPGWDRPKNDQDRRRIDSVMFATQMREQLRERSAFGSGSRIAITDRYKNTITVEDQEFSITRRDSIAVIMVRVPPEPEKRVVTSVRISPDSAPAASPKVWSSGDTIFHVHTPYEKQMELVRQFLTRTPEIAAFLRQ